MKDEIEKTLSCVVKMGSTGTQTKLRARKDVKKSNAHFSLSLKRRSI